MAMNGRLCEVGGQVGEGVVEQLLMAALAHQAGEQIAERAAHIHLPKSVLHAAQQWPPARE